jgi:tetratricopeptide (TPR) repeat protein
VEQSGREDELVAGRYRVVRELARGGVGAVYEALDASTGKRVALKRLLHDPAQKPRLAMLFESEYDTLARLRHPRIVEVFDYGIDKHGPYFTMELLDGRDIGELEPVPYRDACRYLRDVASSLALLHTRRRLHRDLSPRNVRITSDGRCRLLDFGTMASFGVAEDIVGTPPLVPPEALRGTALDHRADLYSLGALAYRVLSGRYPYRARQLEDLPELWRSPPVRLRELIPELPSELDELVMSMLSMDPAYRPTTTYEVIDRLTAIAALEPDEDRGLTAQGYLVGSRLIGRTRQMESIQRHIARAHREQGSVIIIEGNPGVGKSRLLDEAALHGQLSGALTVRVDARAQRGDYAVANALMKAIVEAAPKDARDAAAPYTSVLRQVFDVFGSDPAPALAGAEPGAHTRVQLHAALLGFLFDLSDDRTLVLLVDDLPRVDESSGALLTTLAQQIKRHRIVFIAARRLADQAATQNAIETIVSQARRLRVHRLRRENTTALLEALFGAVPNVELFANWIHDVTTGSPTQIMELCRHLVRENIVRFVDGLWVLPPAIPQDDLPRNLAATLSARAAALSAPERALAEALCVRRGALSLPLCLKLSDEKDTRALFRNLDELVAKGVLVSGATGYHFGQDALREVLLDELPHERAQLLHLRLGEALLELGSERAEDSIEAGFNLLLGGAEERGADILARAAARLPGRGSVTSNALPALEAALELYEKWGRPPSQCLKLRAVMVGSTDRRIVGQYSDVTLSALSEYAGAHYAQRLQPWLGARLGFIVGAALATLRYHLTPARRRGPRPSAAGSAFFRAAFGVLSVRTSVLDVVGTERLVQQVAAFAAASEVSRLLAELFHAQWLALRGEVADALESGRQVLDQLRADREPALQLSAAARSGALTSVYIGLGMVEAQYSLHGRRVLEIIDKLILLPEQTKLGTSRHPAQRSVGVSQPELGLVIHQLRLAYHLVRGERSQAEARRGELLMHSVQTGMQFQFDVWRNLLECNMSARSMDAASLRRCVEIFIHYVADYPELVPCLEMARAHLAHCLGKPQEALSLYEKWLPVIQPGEMAGWDGLYSGYADALLALGRAADARAFMLRTLEHRVLQRAPESTCRVTIETLLAWAEAECREVAPARERIERLLHDVRSADQPLVVGFVHETAARIAHRAGDEATRGLHLKAMKRWYSSTRNAALLMRAQRVYDSLLEPKPPPATSAALESEAERGAVTRVTTRREVSSIDALFEETADRQEQREHALHFVVEAAAAKSGYLYLVGEDGPQLSASSSGEPEEELERAVLELLQRPYAGDHAFDAQEIAAIPLALESGASGVHRGLFFLLGRARTHAIGAVVVCANDEPVRPVPTELLLSIARNLAP